MGKNKKKMIEIWGKRRKVDGTLAHLGLWSWLCPCMPLVGRDSYTESKLFSGPTIFVIAKITLWGAIVTFILKLALDENFFAEMLNSLQN